MNILIVDDEEIIRMMARKILEKFGAEVVTAESGEEGVSYFRENSGSVDLVLMDYSMPCMSGVETLVEMRKISASIPCIFSSGNPMSVDSLPVELHANTYYLEKPYRAPSLTSMVEDILVAPSAD